MLFSSFDRTAPSSFDRTTTELRQKLAGAIHKDLQDGRHTCGWQKIRRSRIGVVRVNALE
jgi:hypothetical protein